MPQVKKAGARSLAAAEKEGAARAAEVEAAQATVARLTAERDRCVRARVCAELASSGCLRFAVNDLAGAPAATDCLDL